MKKTNNPLFSGNITVVRQALSKKCNINQKELFSSEFFIDDSWSYIADYQYPTIRLSPLQYACLQRHEDIALSLIDAGANIHIFDANQTSILQMAAITNAVRVIDKIANFVDVNYCNHLGSALHIACEAQATDSALCLLNHGANANLKCNGYTPVMIACQYYNKRILNKMFETQKIPLGNISFVVCMNNNLNPLLFLLDHGVKLNYKNKNGCSLLHAACLTQGPSYKIVQYLIEHGLSVGDTDNFGNTPLHLACESHNYKAIELLLSNSANVNIQNTDGDTPLVYSAKNGRFHLKLFRSLIKYGADLTLPNSESKTLFDYITKQQKQSVLDITQGK